jgi:hypothetical protein
MTTVSSISVGENLPDKKWEIPRRKSHMAPIVTSQNERTDVAAIAPNLGMNR